MNFSDITINGIPLLAIIVGLVQFVKEMGLHGKWLRAVSAAIGVILGLLYQLSIKTPADFAGWFGAVVFGLALGITASGLIDVAQEWIERLRA